MNVNVKKIALLVGKILLSIVVVLCLMFAGLEIYGFFYRGKQENLLREYSKSFDISNLQSSTGGIRSAQGEKGYQHGTIEFKDKTVIKYWFVSHHVAGRSFTIFELPTGERIEMHDHFCCEVYFEKQFRDLIEFKEYIKKNDGITPYPGLFE